MIFFPFFSRRCRCECKKTIEEPKEDNSNDDITMSLIKAFIKNPSDKMVDLMNMNYELKCANIEYFCVRYMSDDEEENRRNRAKAFDEYLKKVEEIEARYREKLTKNREKL